MLRRHGRKESAQAGETQLLVRYRVGNAGTAARRAADSGDASVRERARARSEKLLRAHLAA